MNYKGILFFAGILGNLHLLFWFWFIHVFLRIFFKLSKYVWSANYYENMFGFDNGIIKSKVRWSVGRFLFHLHLCCYLSFTRLWRHLSEIQIFTELLKIFANVPNQIHIQFHFSHLQKGDIFQTNPIRISNTRNSFLRHLQFSNVPLDRLLYRVHNLSQVNINYYQSNDPPPIIQNSSTGNSTPFQTLDLSKIREISFLFVSNNQKL